MITKQQFFHRVPEQIRVIPIVEPEGDFTQIGRKMLGTDLMIRADETAFEQAPDVFDGVGVVFAGGFPLRFVDLCVRGNPFKVVAFVGVGDDHFDVLSQVAFNEFSEAFPVQFGEGVEPDFAAAFNHANPTGFAMSFAADKGFIHFNHAVQFSVVLHGFADAVAEIPRRFVGYAQCAFKLVGGRAFLGFAHDIDGQKPFPERQMGVVKDAAGHDGELVAAGVAFVLAALAQLREAFGLAARTARAVRPAYVGEVIAALFLGAEVLNQFD